MNNNYGVSTILSVYPVACQKMLPHNGYVTYQHPKADRNKIIIREYNPERLAHQDFGGGRDLPDFSETIKVADANQGHTLIRVVDTWQWVRDYVVSNASAAGATKPFAVLSTEVAQTLVNEWSRDTVGARGGAGGPGLLKIAGYEPTPDELRYVIETQDNFFNFLVDEAHQMHSTNDPAEQKKITELHRVAAIHCGYMTLPWVNKREVQSLKKCPSCGREILAIALGCEHCTVNLPKFYKEMDDMPDPKVDPVVYAYMMKKSGNPPVRPNLPGKPNPQVAA